MGHNASNASDFSCYVLVPSVDVKKLSFSINVLSFSNPICVICISTLFRPHIKAAIGFFVDARTTCSFFFSVSFRVDDQFIGRGTPRNDV